MKTEILVEVKGVENENLSNIREVEEAIKVIRKFARNTKNLTEHSFAVETAELYGNVKKENTMCVSMTIEVDGLEDILGNIAVLTEKLKTEIVKMDKAIIIGIKTPVRE